MFGIFKKKSETEKLNEEYKKLMAKSAEVSRVNRQEGDKLFVKAQEILAKIEKLEKNQA